MGNMKSLQILRGSSSAISQSTETLLKGQPLFDYSNNLLYVGDGSTTPINERTPIYATGIKLKDGAKSLTLNTSTTTNALILTQGTDSITYTLPQSTSTLSQSTLTLATTIDVQYEANQRSSFDTELSSRIDVLEASLAELTYSYTPISFTSFKHNGSNTTTVNLMKGSTYTGGTLTWAFNSTPATLTINGSSTNVNTTSYTLSSSTINTTTTIKATHSGEYGKTSSTTKYFSVNFDWGVYLGVSAKDTLSTADINALEDWYYSQPASYTFNMNAQYAYVVSTRSNLTFKDNNGLTVDFNKSTVQHTNEYRASTTFYVYRTNNVQGSTSSTASVTYKIS